MQLKKLKLSGFKSFVDPTTVLFPSHCVGVVGPNGCGKSNIIDAIRWVMGEISAKTLRGATMSDVIFNGSTTRKPVGQASVELVFDNTDSRLTGEYSQYAEISLRRVVSRDGQSNYYLNGTRCRRKDVADIFLGTGLGARSYAIIGQNTISQLIEAKPNDLRLFIEEAANISKYKDRRNDAQTRMENTRDNLCRLADIREELNKQVSRLERQAAAASKYTEWKKEAQKLHIECDLMRWKQWQQALGMQETQINGTQSQCEALITQRRELNQKIAEIKTQHQTASAAQQQKQAVYYQLGIESARLKETIANQNKQYEQFSLEKNRTETELNSALDRLKKEEHQFQALSEEITLLTPELSTLAQTKEAAEKALAQSETEKQTWQKDWDHFNNSVAESMRKMQVLQTQITHSEKTIQHTEARISQLEKERDSLEKTSQIEAAITNEEKEEISLKQEAENIKQALENCIQTLSEHRKNNEAKRHESDLMHKKLQQMQGELTGLNALQEAALGKKDESLKQWLNKQSFADAPRLTQKMEVTEGWEKAVEHIFGNRLQSICVEDFDSLGNLDQLTTSLPKGECTFVNLSYTTSSISQKTSVAEGLESLLNKIQNPHDAIKNWLAGIYIADNLEHAKNLQPQLLEHESLITPEGAWLGKGWLQWTQGKQGHHGLLQREQAIKTLTNTLEQQKNQWEEEKKAYENGRTVIITYETQREKLNEQIQLANQKWMNHSTQIRIKKSQLENLQERHKLLDKNILEQQDSLKRSLTQKETHQAEWQLVSKEANKNDQLREQWIQTRDNLYKRYEACRIQVQKDRENWHTLDIKLTRLNTEQIALQKNIAREKENKIRLEKHREQNITSLQQAQSTNINLQTQWEDISKKHTTEASSLEEANTVLKNLDEQLQNSEKIQADLESQINTLQSQLEKKRLDAQTLRVKCENIEEGLKALNQDSKSNSITDITNTEDIDIPLWEEHIKTLNNKIQKLGPINLAALEEFKTESERKTELDEQCQDLTNALETLEAAIRTIDEETRGRFQETYDKINEAFQALFPRLFGGGRATLDLTSNNALEAGVSIMAQPPGKKNSSIHLLSGGEKAMTAIALVFAIFQLNPSPFCLLDEVDAPLDDSNVSRFCAMVKEMSEQVQFIFITHNKITMELATHLSGVTMREPGVSRLVTVDVDEAVSLALEA